MDKVIDINKIILPKGKVLLKVVEKKSKIVSPHTLKEENPLFSHYEVVLTNDVSSIEIQPGDIVVAASGIGSQGGFMIGEEMYIIINGFNIDAAVKPDNFKFD